MKQNASPAIPLPAGPRKTGPNEWTFTLWAPHARSVTLRFPLQGCLGFPLERGENGYWSLVWKGAWAGDCYHYFLDKGRAFPDPGSHWQPDGVEGLSALVDHENFSWTDAGFRAPDFRDWILYELHVGAFTPEGSFQAACERVGDLAALGITAVEIMPVAQFPGTGNWGYDGVFPYAVQHSYGGPEGLKRFVDSCHRAGLAVVLDAVYNHLGPEGNYFKEFGPYFSSRFKTPWGPAMNFDGPGSDGVNDFFLGNAAFWFEHYHIDGLRLDAVNHILDMRPQPFLARLSRLADTWPGPGGPKILIGEDDRNDARFLLPRPGGGLGLAANWNEDFHHAAHALLSGETNGYFGDYGTLGHMARVLEETYCFQGEYSSYYERGHGAPARGLSRHRFVAYLQNHDQVGNRPDGARLSTLLGFEQLKLGAALLLLSPFTPLLFMGEEYGEDNPFPYFISHADPGLAQAVRQGRAREYKRFGWEKAPAPDPAAPETFHSAVPDWNKRTQGGHAALLALHAELIRLRRELPALRGLEAGNSSAAPFPETGLLALHRRAGNRRALCLFNFSGSSTPLSEVPALELSSASRLLDTAAPKWRGPGSDPDRIAPYSALLFVFP